MTAIIIIKVTRKADLNAVKQLKVPLWKHIEQVYKIILSLPKGMLGVQKKDNKQQQKQPTFCALIL